MVRYFKLGNLLPALLLLLGCSEQPQPPASKLQTSTPAKPELKIVATFLPMYWFTKAVTGEKAEVEVLVPPGSDLHEYQATPANIQAIAQADVLVKNGLNLEEFLETTIKNAQNKKLKEIEASAGISALEEVSPIEEPVKSGDDKEHEHSHSHSGGNPHVWLDPILAKQQVEVIRDNLIEVDPKNKETYQANAAAYIQQLEQLDAEFKQKLAKYPNCTFITFHDAFPYLAKRYNLKQVAVVDVPEASLSPADVQRTIEAVKKYNVKALFGEPGVDNKLLSSLSKDLNLALRPLDSLEIGPLEPQHYFSAMRKNLETIESACK
jgi:zinc/manganese transport system substrate-binding protein